MSKLNNDILENRWMLLATLWALSKNGIPLGNVHLYEDILVFIAKWKVLYAKL
jgi:hypothetical protein